MLPDESTRLTTAQRALLQFISREDADSLYRNLSATLGMAIINGADADDPFIPTISALHDWYYTLLLLDHIHAIAAEQPAGAQEDTQEIPSEFGS